MISRVLCSCLCGIRGAAGRVSLGAAADPHFTGEIRAGAKLLPSGFFCTCVCVCLCVHLSVRAGAECWVSKARRAPVSALGPWPLAQLGFGFLSRAGQRGRPLQGPLLSRRLRHVRSVHHPTEPLLLLGSLSFLSLFYFKVAFCNKRNKKNAFGWFRWR